MRHAGFRRTRTQRKKPYDEQVFLGDCTVRYRSLERESERWRNTETRAGWSYGLQEREEIYEFTQKPTT